MKHRLHLAIGLALSAACLAWVLKELDFARLWELARQVNLLYPLAVVLLLAVTFWLRSQRWRILLRPVKQTGLANLYQANLIGFGANNLLPARLGELVRAYAVGRLEGVAASSALATIVVERVLDGLMLVLVLFLALMFVKPGARAGAFSVAHLRAAGLGLLAVYLAVLGLVAALWRWPGTTVDKAAGLAGRLSPGLGQKVRESLESFHHGLAILARARSLPSLVGLSLLLWAAVLGGFWVFLPAVGLAASPVLAAMALAGSSVGVAVPAGPGYAGTFQLAVTWALMMAGADQQRALAYSLLLWAVNYFPLTAAGLWLMWRKGMALGGLSRQGRRLAEKSS